MLCQQRGEFFVGQKAVPILVVSFRFARQVGGGPFIRRKLPVIVGVKLASQASCFGLVNAFDPYLSSVAAIGGKLRGDLVE